MIIDIQSVAAGANYDITPTRYHLVRNCGVVDNGVNIQLYDGSNTVVVAVGMLADDEIGGTFTGLPLRALMTTNSCYIRATNTTGGALVLRYQALEI